VTIKRNSVVSLGILLSVVGGLVVMGSCGGSSSSTTTTTTTPPPTLTNLVSLSVNLGLTGDYVDGLFTSVEVCAPGSTTNCTTIPDVLVDTGSAGLRLLSGSLGTVSLPSVTDSSGNEIQECIQYVSLAYTWGPIAQADIHLGGETASKAAVQIVSETPSPATPPDSCLSAGVNGAFPENSASALGANGILGVANYGPDCSGCTLASNEIPQYFVCPSGNCTIANVPSTGIVTNPVSLFSTDNNGVLVSLPNVSTGGAATVAGTLYFGIGTESNNGLGSATIYAVDNANNFTTTYSSAQYTDSFIDSGSNALYFLDANTLGGNIECAYPNTGFYCPASTLGFTVTNSGINGTSGSFSFNIANAANLFSTGYAAFNNLGGDSGTSPSTDYFDFGVPFFFNRNVFVGIAGTTVPNGVSAPYGYWAY